MGTFLFLTLFHALPMNKGVCPYKHSLSHTHSASVRMIQLHKEFFDLYTYAVVHGRHFSQLHLNLFHLPVTSIIPSTFHIVCQVPLVSVNMKTISAFVIHYLLDATRVHSGASSSNSGPQGSSFQTLFLVCVFLWRKNRFTAQSAYLLTYQNLATKNSLRILALIQLGGGG